MTLKEAKKLLKAKEQTLFSKEELKPSFNSSRHKSADEYREKQIEKKGKQK